MTAAAVGLFVDKQLPISTAAAAAYLYLLSVLLEKRRRQKKPEQLRKWLNAQNNFFPSVCVNNKSLEEH